MVVDNLNGYLLPCNIFNYIAISTNKTNKILTKRREIYGESKQCTTIFKR
jgi:hypothetical protein